GSINGRSGSIFQHLHGFDVVGIQPSQFSFIRHSIDYIQRIVIVYGTESPDAYLRGGSWRTIINDLHTGSLALKRFNRTGRRLLLQVLYIDYGNRAGQIFYALCRVTGYDHLVQGAE